MSLAFEDEEIPNLDIVFQTEPLDEGIVAFAASQDGALFAVGTMDEAISVFDVFGRLQTQLPGHNGGTNSLTFLPPAGQANQNGEVASTRIASAGEDGALKIWDVESGHLLKRFVCEGVDADKGPFGWTVENVAANAEGTKVACSAGKTVHLFWVDRLDEDDENAATMPPVEGGTITSVQFTESGWLLYSWYNGLSMAPPGPGSKAVALESVKNLLCAASSPDNRWFVAGMYDAMVHIWKLEADESAEGAMQTVEMTCGGYEGKVTICNWQPGQNGTLMASCGGSCATIWDFSGDGPCGTSPTIAAGHLDTVSCQAWRHDGSTWMATGAKDGSVAVFVVSRHHRNPWAEIDKFCGPVAIYDGTGLDAITAIAWPCTDIILAASANGVVRAYKVPEDVQKRVASSQVTPSTAEPLESQQSHPAEPQAEQTTQA